MTERMNQHSGSTALDDKPTTWLAHLPGALTGLNPNDSPDQWLRELAARELDLLPLPGAGNTLLRWQILAAVASHDLSLAKLYEGHTDALAILAELVPRRALETFPNRTLWGMWAAESRVSKVIYEVASNDAKANEVKLFGTKTWCSGASHVTHGLLTAWAVDGVGPQLVTVALNQAGVVIESAAWRAVGMASSGSVDVSFDGAVAYAVGKPTDYLNRPGFWQGGAGVAACWYGGALTLGRALQKAVSQTPSTQRNPYQLAALGKVDLSLHSTAGLLREAAQWIDEHPRDNAQAVAVRVRLAAEGCARRVLDEAGRALGAAAFCHDAQFARAAADLPVFIRQSHGERDFAHLGTWATAQTPPSWNL
jgi:hypothetical protein